ncbi:uncharacterized protein LOC131144799 [Malania oleifera]|uniref:uncharacterized protein LOC131144799 n=1 Tax=Malania oleifera TaxID=397392 RepID=UPI0025AE431D|nr:uncharacterized protein LOC131144799 [Malania oleifera]
MFKLWLLVGVVLLNSNPNWGSLRLSEAAARNSISIVPPTCSRIECPAYDLVHAGNGFEIRRYNPSVWMSTTTIQNISLVGATRTGFRQLFNYIQGNNDDKQKVEMTAPVMTQLLATGDGPLCESSFDVSFYVPKVNQANPPSAKGLHVQRWNSTYAAVRQFDGFASDQGIGQEAAALQAALAGSAWSDAINKSRAADPKSSAYAVAQYNSPFQIENRVNEIWMTFELKDGSAAPKEKF